MVTMTDPGATSSLADKPAAAVSGAPALDRAKAAPDASAQATYLTQAFVWMVAGLLLSAGVPFVPQWNEPLLRFAAGNFLVLIVAQLVLVFAIQLGINRLGATAGLGLFFVYAASVGLTLGLIVAGL